MKTKSPLFRIDRLLAAALALLATQQAYSQTTFTWTNTGSSTTFLTAGNWQTNSATATTAPTNSTSVARLTNSTNLATIGINLNTLSGTLNMGSILKESSGNITLNNSSTTVSGQMRIFGTVSGADTNLIVSLGSGVLTLTNGPSQAMDLQLATGGIINVSNVGGRVVLASLIKEDAGETNTITKTGAGTLVISGTDVNTWGGGVVLNAGVLQLNKASALGSVSGLGLTINGGSLDNGGGAAVTLSNYAQTWGGNFTFIGTTNLNLGAGAVNLTGTRTVTVTANALTVGGTITNTGGITKAGAGTLILNGANTYTGTTTVNAGTLSLGNVNALQNSLLDTGLSGSQVVTFTVGGNNTYNIGGLQGSDDLDIGGNTLSIGLSGGNTTYSGALSGAGALVKTGAGTFTLTSSNNAYSGGTTINGGAVEITGANRLGNASGALNINDGKLLVTTTGLSSGRNIVLGNANSTIEVASGITYTATNTSVVSGSGRLNKTGLGVLALYGTNTYSGGTVVSAGTLAGDTAGVRGAITNNATVNFLITTNGTYSGAMTGIGALTKSGAATLTTTGVNDFSGATTISAGTLLVNGTNANSAVTINSGATLGGSGSVGAVTVSSGGVISPGNSPGTLAVTALTLNGGGSYRWEITDATAAAGTGWDVINVASGAGVVTLNANSGSQFTINVIGTNPSNFLATTSRTWDIIDAGSWSAAFDASAFLINTNDFSATGTLGTWSVANNSGNLQLLYTAPVLASVYTWNAGSGAWSSGANWANTIAPTNGSSLIFAGAGGVSTNDNTLNNVNDLTFSNTAGSYTLTGSAFTNGANGIVNNSASAQTISNDITLGAAQSFNATAGDLTFAGAIDNNGNTLTIAGASNTLVSGEISGSGGLTKSGNGSLALGANSSYTGSLNANGGTTLINGTQATTTINVGGGTLLLGSNNRLADGATVSLTTGTLNLGGFSDTITTFNQSGGVFTNGTLSATTYGLSGGTVGGTLSGGTANVSGAVSLSGVINSALNVNSGGTLTLSANDRIGNSSAVTVSAGTLAIGASSDTVAALVLTNNGSLTGSGTLTAATYTLNGGTVGANLGAGSATSTTGTTALNGTLAGDLAISGGTVTLGGNNRIDDAAAVSVSSGTLNFGGFADTVGSFSLSGGVFTNGTATTSIYSLSGGTMGGTLGAGTANVTGGVTLSGVINSTLSVNTGGTLTLAAANRISDSSAVTVAGGSLNFGGFADTVGNFTITGGTLTNGTLTAATYALQGGTVAGNLGVGTANVTGNTALNGTAAATTVNVSGSTLTLGSAGRLAAGSTVNITNSGTLTLAGAESISALVLSNGTLGGSGQTLTAASYALQGGTVSANLGTGTATVSTNTTTINGNLGGALTASSGTANLNGTVAGNVTVSGGTVNLGSADRIGNSSAVNVSSGALNLNGNDSVGAVTLTGGTIGGSGTLTGTSYAVQGGTISTAIGGSGAMTKTGAGTTTLAADSSASYSGAVAVNSGAILATSTGALGSGTVTVTNGSTLAAAGVNLNNNFNIGAIGSVTAGTNVWVAAWDFQTTNNGGTAMSVAPGSPNVLLANFGAQAGNAAIYLNGSNGSSLWSSPSSNPELTSFSGTAVNATNGMSTTTTGAATLALANSSANGKYVVFTLDMSGLASLNLSYASQRSGTGFDTQVWEYSTDGTTWTGFYTNSSIAGSFAVYSNATSLTALSNSATAYLRLTVNGATATSGNNRLDNIQLNAVSVGATNAPTGSGTLGISEAGAATFSGNVTINNTATFTAAENGQATFSGVVSGSGTALTKTGAGTVTLSGSSANTFTNMTTVSAGTLELAKSADTTALAGKVTVNSGAVLLLSSSHNVANTAGVTLSGGTITRGSGVSEVFGNLNLTQASFLDFGTGTTGTLAFGTYTPSALLTVNNFFQGNTLTFGSNLTDAINDGALFAFDNGFTTNWSGSTFTITAIPEPSTYLAAAGLLGLMLWPSRRLIMRDAKKILGLTPPMRDRLARRAS